MNKEALFYQNSYCFEFRAKVLSCVPAGGKYEVRLDSSYFYPTGGGQPCDRGFIEGADVTDVFEKDEEIFHLLDSPVESGKEVRCEIDKEYRLTFMRSHSGEHIFSGYLHKLTGADNIGFHMNQHLITIDFSCEIDDNQLSEAELLTNKTILENIGILCYFPSDAEIDKISYRQKKELNGPIRLVEVPGVDICACCGLHVAKSSEICLVKVVSYQKYKTGCRIQLAAGFPAMNMFFTGYKQLQTISGLTSKPVLEVSSGVLGLKNDIETLKANILSIKNKYLEILGDNPEIINGVSYACLVDGSSADLITLCNVLKKHACAAVALSQSGEDICYICISAGDEKIKDLINTIAACYTVKGGGRNGMYQGWVQTNADKIKRIL